jgi:hypothetical protein
MPSTRNSPFSLDVRTDLFATMTWYLSQGCRFSNRCADAFVSKKSVQPESALMVLVAAALLIALRIDRGGLCLGARMVLAEEIILLIEEVLIFLSKKK